MAANKWDNSTTDGLANTAANWSLGNVPTGTDVATFDNTSDTNCTFDVNISCAGINVTSDYDGDIDMVTHDLTTTSDMTFDGTGIFDCGTGTLTCAGNLDNKDQGTWTRGSSTVVMNGAGTELTGHSTKYFANLTIAANVELMAATVSGVDVWGVLTVDGGVTFTLSDRCALATASADLQNSGIIDGTGTLWIRNTCNVTVPGTISCNQLEFQGTHNGNVAAGQYDSAVVKFLGFGTKTFTFAAGSYTFTGDVTFDANVSGLTYTVTNNAATEITFGGDVTLSETGGGGAVLTWNKSASADAVIFDDTTEYTDDTAAVQVLGDVETSDGASLTLAFEMECDDLTIAQNSTIAGAFLFDVGGNFVINGTSGNTVSWTDADLDVTGTAVAHYTTATDSDASAGTEITATDNCVDGGGNPNWDFGAGTILPHIMQLSS